MTKNYTFTTKSSGVTVALPLFIPVYRPDHSFELFDEDIYRCGLKAVMVNAFLLFREQSLKAAFEQGYTLREHIGGFEGVICTDSGAFQQLSGRKVDIDPLEIVKFQNMIKTDIAAPLDLITPPDTGFEETGRRMIISQYRIEEALETSHYSDLAGIQQGGGYFSLRQKHIRQLAETGIKYYGIGSMVPFFNKNHDLSFTCSVVSDARSVIGESAPMHVYGAGDPLDIAFMFYAGANIFDSSSYAHYAQRGYYMTPYGAVNKRAACERLDFNCSCPVCSRNEASAIFDKTSGEPLRMQHNLFMILKTIGNLGAAHEKNKVEAYISSVYDRHVGNMDLFPGTMLAPSWENYLKGDKSDSLLPKSGSRPTTGINAMEPGLPLSIAVRSIGSDIKVREMPGLSETENEVIALLAAESASLYKMDESVITEILEGELQTPKNVYFRSRINSVGSVKEAQRLSEYKAFKKSSRAKVYQKLRQYKQPDVNANELIAELIECPDGDIDTVAGKLLELHVSTRERLREREEFIGAVKKVIRPGSSAIDVGCGFSPLLFPAEFFKGLSCYFAVDKDTEATETIRVFAKKRGIPNLLAYTWDISNGLSALSKLTGTDTYDIALMLKLIPVVSRTDQAAGGNDRSMQVLGDFPASRILATVNRESMTKHESIEKRELSILKQFARAFGLNIEAEFSCGGETGFCFSKR